MKKKNPSFILSLLQISSLMTFDLIFVGKMLAQLGALWTKKKSRSRWRRRRENSSRSSLFFFVLFFQECF